MSRPPPQWRPPHRTEPDAATTSPTTFFHASDIEVAEEAPVSAPPRGRSWLWAAILAAGLGVGFALVALIDWFRLAYLGGSAA